MKEQLLDTMELERERGITIKLQPVRMEHNGYILNLIDTPGHVDFTYEVSRSLAAVEGAILLVDSTQGIQAQTIANLYLALEQNLTIIPVLNKIDLPASDIEKTTAEIVDLLGCDASEIIHASGKTGAGVEEIIKAVIERLPPPKGDADKPLQALIFDSMYDEYKGVIAYVRIFEGQVKRDDRIHMIATEKDNETLEVGHLKPNLKPSANLSAGEIGYIVTGLKDIEKCRVGDTITLKNNKAKPLPGYKEVRPMVFAGIFCKEGNDFARLREAIGKLKLNDSALMFEPEHSIALGFGFRCGFLGLLHLEIFQERLAREYDMDLVVTVPSVAYKVTLKPGVKIDAKIKKEQILNQSQILIKSPAELPDPSQVEYIEEPMVKLDIITPTEYMGNVMQLVQDKRGEYINTEYLSSGTGKEERAILHYRMPLSMVITDLYDKLKSVSSGYASLNYEFEGYQKADVVKMDIHVAEEPVEALATIVYKDAAYYAGKKVVEALKEIIPKQMFVVKLQAVIGSKVIASERLSAMRKDVTAKLYGGDWTRKQKLLNKQKKGKKKMMEMGKGRVEIPSEAFLKILKK